MIMMKMIKIMVMMKMVIVMMVMMIVARWMKLMATHRPTLKRGSDKLGSSTIALHRHEDVHRTHLGNHYQCKTEGQ